jgi:transposase
VVEFKAMNDEITALPDNIESLKALILAQRSQLAERDTLIRSIQNELRWEQEKYKSLCARYFGSSSEKSHEVPGQWTFEFNEAETYVSEEPAPVKVIEVAAHQRKGRGRKPQSGAIETVEIVHDLPEDQKICPCCGKMRPTMGEVRSTEYELIPAHVVRKIHIRKQYGSCRCDDFGQSTAPAVLCADGPAKIVPKSEFSNSTIAFFMVGKYEDAIPFYRMEKVLARSGLIVSRATLCNLAIGVGRAIEDLIDLMWQDVRKSPVILMDETKVQVLREPGRQAQQLSYMWVTCGYSKDREIVLFHYHPTRKKLVPEHVLENWTGYLQTDGYEGYEAVGKRDGVEHVGCFAHIRRGFVDARKVNGSDGLAGQMIELIGEVYAIERDLRQRYENGTLSTAEFIEKRKAKLESVFTKMRLWLSCQSLTVAPSTKLGEAIGYASGHLEKAVRFVEHELLTPDTNRVENAIRPFVVGRKNWEFCATPLGAHASAGIYSLLETAKANGHDPYKYLCYLFEALPRATTTGEKRKLLPYQLMPSDY